MALSLGLVLLAGTGSANERAACAPVEGGLLLISCAGETSVEVLRLDDPSRLNAPAPDSLIVTGAYTSGERREPEGLFIERGKPFDPYPQGWDGVAIVDGKAQLSLHHVERVLMDGDRWNLRDRDERKAFLARAESEGWSALQSHMLVIDGEIDTKPREDAPRFRRRILFADPAGDFGVFDTSPKALTLHEAAELIHDRFRPAMAFNLDMGSYDFCEQTSAGKTRNCGHLTRDQIGKLSNLLMFRQIPKPAQKEARLESAAE